MSDNPASSKERMAHTLLTRLHKIAPRMRVLLAGAVVVGAALTMLTTVFMQRVLETHAQADAINTKFEQCRRVTDDLQNTSDYLTNQARSYVNTGNENYLANYLNEVFVLDHRGSALKTLQELTHDERATGAMESARRESDKLSEVELYALRLAEESYESTYLPQEITDVELSEEDAQLDQEGKRAKAYELVYGADYNTQKLTIRERVQTCSELLFGSLRADLEKADEAIDFLVRSMQLSVIGLLLDVVFSMVSTIYLMLWPMALHAESIRDGLPLESLGARELRYLTDAYNEMYEKNHNETRSLEYEADHDALTGLLNRGAYDELLSEHRHDSALVLVDVDKFKNFNDDFGHEMGDAILIEVAATLFGSFRTSDYICRIGGDEFAVIATGFDRSHKGVIVRKLEKVAAFLRDTENGLPPVTISVGVAFGRYGITQDDLFKAADNALYETKRRGRDGFTFAE